MIYNYLIIFWSNKSAVSISEVFYEDLYLAWFIYDKLFPASNRKIWL